MRKTNHLSSSERVSIAETMLAITPVGLCIESLPCLPSPSGGFVKFVPFAQSARFLPGRSKSASFTMLQEVSMEMCMQLCGRPYLVNRFDYPIDSGVASDGFVLRVNEDYFEILVGRVLVDPVGVQHPQVSAAAANTLFGRGLE